MVLFAFVVSIIHRQTRMHSCSFLVDMWAVKFFGNIDITSKPRAAGDHLGTWCCRRSSSRTGTGRICTELLTNAIEMKRSPCLQEFAKAVTYMTGEPIYHQIFLVVKTEQHRNLIYALKNTKQTVHCCHHYEALNIGNQGCSLCRWVFQK